VTVESEIQGPISGEKRGPDFAESKLGPTAALLSFFGTCSLVGCIVLPHAGLPPLLVVPVVLVSCLFYLIAIMTSSIAFLELLAAGISKAGSVSFAGVHLRGNLLGVLYLGIYLLPWSLIFIAVVFGVLLSSRG
jgi:hypothetical protein